MTKQLHSSSYRMKALLKRPLTNFFPRKYGIDQFYRFVVDT